MHTLKINDSLCTIKQLEKILLSILPHGIDQTDFFQIYVVLDEIILNIQEHGFKRLKEGGYIFINLAIEKETLSLRIRDNGAYFDPTHYTPKHAKGSVSEQPIGGIGISLIRHFVDSIKYERCGNENRTLITKYMSKTIQRADN